MRLGDQPQGAEDIVDEGALTGIRLVEDRRQLPGPHQVADNVADEDGDASSVLPKPRKRAGYFENRIKRCVGQVDQAAPGRQAVLQPRLRVLREES